MEIANPVHPGEFIRELYPEFVEGLYNEDGSTNNPVLEIVSKKLHLEKCTTEAFLSGEVGVNAELAIRLSDVLGRSAESWMMLQMCYDLAMERNKSSLRGLTEVIFYTDAEVL